jgi:hypothetical protein
MADAQDIVDRLRALWNNPSSFDAQQLSNLAGEAADLIDALIGKTAEADLQSLRKDVTNAIEMEWPRDDAGTARCPPDQDIVASCASLARAARLANLRSIFTSAIPVAPEFTGLRAAMSDVLAERVGQVEREGYSPAHDDQHPNGELALAGALYASPIPLVELVDTVMGQLPRDPWPFFDYERCGQDNQGNPIYREVPSCDNRAKHSRRRRLVIGAAMIIADIERLDRSITPCLAQAHNDNPVLSPARN